MNSVQLAEYFGCSDDTILRRLKENGIIPHKFCEDLTGRRFGKLVVLQKSEKSGRRLYWDCKCDCGNLVIVVGSVLRQGRQESCGCINSKTEIIIANLLRQNNIQFISQYTFNDLISEYNNIKYRFDFGVIENNNLKYLIEYDGEMHSNKNFNGFYNLENYKKLKREMKLKINIV